MSNVPWGTKSSLIENHSFWSIPGVSTGGDEKSGSQPWWGIRVSREYTSQRPPVSWMTLHQAQGPGALQLPPHWVLPAAPETGGTSPCSQTGGWGSESFRHLLPVSASQRLKLVWEIEEEIPAPDASYTVWFCDTGSLKGWQPLRGSSLDHKKRNLSRKREQTLLPPSQISFSRLLSLDCWLRGGWPLPLVPPPHMHSTAEWVLWREVPGCAGPDGCLMPQHPGLPVHTTGAITQRNRHCALESHPPHLDRSF